MALEDWLSENNRAIADHIIGFLLIELGLGLGSLLARFATDPGLIRTMFLRMDEISMLGAAAILIRNLGVNLWKNRERFDAFLFA